MSENFSNHEIYRGLKQVSEVSDSDIGFSNHEIYRGLKRRVRPCASFVVLVTMKFTGVSNNDSVRFCPFLF